MSVANICSNRIKTAKNIKLCFKLLLILNFIRVYFNYFNKKIVYSSYTPPLVQTCSLCPMLPSLLSARQTLVLRYLVGCWGYDRHELQETRQRGEFIIIRLIYLPLYIIFQEPMTNILL